MHPSTTATGCAPDARSAVGIVVRALACAAMLALSGVAAAEQATGYALDPVHTRVLVAVGHADFSQALGTVSGSHGWLLFDPDDWSSARLDVRVPLSRLDFGDEDWNRAVAARNLLDSDHHPEARFVSTTVTGHDPRHATVCGELSLRGTTRPQCLEVTLNAVGRHPLPPFRRMVGFSARMVLSRAEFGIDAWRSVIGDEVELRIEAEAVRDADALAILHPAVAAAAEAEAATADVTSDPAATYRSLEAAAEAALDETDEPADEDPAAIDPTDDEPTP